MNQNSHIVELTLTGVLMVRWSLLVSCLFCSVALLPSCLSVFLLLVGSGPCPMGCQPLTRLGTWASGNLSLGITGYRCLSAWFPSGIEGHWLAVQSLILIASYARVAAASLASQFCLSLQLAASQYRCCSEYACCCYTLQLLPGQPSRSTWPVSR